MLTKLAILFLLGMVLLAMISARPRRGDRGWRDRFRLRLPGRRPRDGD
ncbi:MAG: hypothetical protein R6V44_01005 [Paracoccaceae bacterium]